MRPVDKGFDRGTFRPYTDAQKPLEDAIGRYCSYCERWIASGIHVEHKLPKGRYAGRKFRWTNFLLSCPNCNSGKGGGELKLSDYVWPDQDNTFSSFIYDREGRIMVSDALPLVAIKKAKELWQLVNLNCHPDLKITEHRLPTDKDFRWNDRRQAWEYAERKKKSLSKNRTGDRIIELADDALQRGFFSIWMAVFCDDKEMRLALIKAFIGTDSNSFDRVGNSRRRLGGMI